MTLRDEGYDLFRQAIVERVADAWTDIIKHFRPLLIAWANASTASTGVSEPSCDIADEALARAWVALTPERFATIPNLAAVLGYLHACVTATAIDHARVRARCLRLAQEVAVEAAAMPDEVVLHDLARAEFWRLLKSLVRTEQEHVILTENMMREIPPRLILRRYPELFCSITEVYSAKRNLFERLRRNAEVQCFNGNPEQEHKQRLARPVAGYTP
jgi:DNA-directed RNA polymerase specialized sigma24 family protein